MSSPLRVFSLVSSFLSIIVTIMLIRCLVDWQQSGFSQGQDDVFLGHPEIAGSHTFRGDDFPGGWTSRAGQALLQVQESTHYTLNNTESDAEWGVLDSMKHGLIVDEEKHVAGLPVFHQLHCVWVLREILLRRPMNRRMHHAHHCSNVLRQWALCRADLTLEPGDFTKRDFERERVGATHVCRDWTRILQDVDENWQDWVAYFKKNHIERYLDQKTFSQ